MRSAPSECSWRYRNKRTLDFPVRIRSPRLKGREQRGTSRTACPVSQQEESCDFLRGKHNWKDPLSEEASALLENSNNLQLDKSHSDARWKLYSTLSSGTLTTCSFQSDFPQWAFSSARNLRSTERNKLAGRSPFRGPKHSTKNRSPRIDFSPGRIRRCESHSRIATTTFAVLEDKPGMEFFRRD